MKRWTLIGLILLSAILFATRMMAQAADFSWQINCQEEVNGQLHYWLGYNSSEALPDSYFGYTGNGPGIYIESVEAGQHPRVVDVIPNGGIVTLYLYPQDISVTVDDNTAAPDCSQFNGAGGQPDGGLKTITKMAAPGCYKWDIQDDYGHWSYVATTCSQQEGDNTFVRLVLGPDNPITDPDRYRIWRVDDGEA